MEEEKIYVYGSLEHISAQSTYEVGAYNWDQESKEAIWRDGISLENYIAENGERPTPPLTRLSDYISSSCPSPPNVMDDFEEFYKITEEKNKERFTTILKGIEKDETR